MFSLRVRSEIRSLPLIEWEKTVSALWVMKTTTSVDGIKKYGASFRTYDSMVAKHITAALHPGGDQAHFSPIFPLFHMLWVLEMENSLLSVDKTLSGVPYWNVLSNPMSVFTEQYLGSFSGTGAHYAVLDGKFARWTIPWSNDVNVPFSNTYNCCPTN